MKHFFCSFICFKHTHSEPTPDWLTHTSDPLCDQVRQQGFQHRTVSGVQLVTIDADMET